MKKALWVGIAAFALACGGEDIEPLPLVEAPAVLEDENPDPRVVEVSMNAATLSHSLGGDLDLDLMAYNGSVPGPLLQARVGDEVIVHFRNDLDEPTTIHWHGLRITDDMDGTPRVQDPVQPGETFTYRFTAPEAGSFWYHPHVRGYEQVERGLYGPMVIHGEHDPDYDLERYIMLDDIRLDENGIAPFQFSHPEQMHGRSGNALLINGVLSDPVQGVAKQGQVERWRVVNPSNARTMSLSVKGANLRVIGTDGGLLPEPYTTDRITMAVGQRYDLEVAYLQPGQAELITHVLTLDDNDEVVEIEIPVAQIAVEETGKQAFMPEWTQPPMLADRQVSRYEIIELDAVSDEDGIHWRLNGMSDHEEPMFVFEQGETTQIILKNLAGPEHPFHLHGQFFRIVGGDPGLKDTVLIRGGETVTIEAYMDNPGRWMAHCHILEHAELGMMSEIVVNEAPSAE
ncbi:MAG: multicopper oxidase family protein [Deltaproteobacteria bacterium]|nr:multicopper oxidase family protein [Deltaproteobacteria bacterium]